VTDYRWRRMPWAVGTRKAPRSNALRQRSILSSALRVVLDPDPEAGAIYDGPRGRGLPQRREPRAFWEGYLGSYLRGGGAVFVDAEDARRLAEILGPRWGGPVEPA
jgi:hypothetical protein